MPVRRLLIALVLYAPLPVIFGLTGIVRGWLAASAAPELKRLREARRAFGKCEPFWSA